MKPSRLQFTVLALVLAGFRTFAASTPDDARAWQQLLEKEWLLEAQLRAESQQATRLAPRDDAAGGCDGVTNGKWGFHTAEQENPWWQVDLGEVVPLQQVRVWNRSDNDGSAQRAAKFICCSPTTARHGVKCISTMARSSMATTCPTDRHWSSNLQMPPRVSCASSSREKRFYISMKSKSSAPASGRTWRSTNPRSKAA